ncbi:MAG TPA: DUF1848 family protein, partial [Candidatus Limnocylindrales bacterium]|nr:DUF1848 family protein [Candidatus Limnocylindrales bacterium]
MTPPVIISASRRTDIPAFFPEWFSACLAAGRAEYRNPYSGRPLAVSLRKDDVAAFVFWTRNPSPFLPALERLEREGFRSLFQFTLTGFSRELEPSVPAFEEAVSAFRRLSERIGPGRVLWRFDPLFPGEPPDALVARFDRVSSSLSGLTARCTVSIAHPYRKSLRTTGTSGKSGSRRTASAKRFYRRLQSAGREGSTCDPAALPSSSNGESLPRGASTGT